MNQQTKDPANQPSHTPGPWGCERKAHSHHGDFLIFSEQNDAFVAEVVGREIESTHEIEANSRLVAAAPELLAELREARSALLGAAIELARAGKTISAARYEAKAERIAQTIAKAEGTHE